MRKVVHFEIPADDLERAKKFYATVFEWRIEDWPMSDGYVYTGVKTVEVDDKTYIPTEPGAINGALVPRDEIVKTPQVTINVPSIDEYLQKIVSAGGKTVKEKQQIEDVGFFAYASDSEGNLIGLWEDYKKQ